MFEVIDQYNSHYRSECEANNWVTVVNIDSEKEVVEIYESFEQYSPSGNVITLPSGRVSAKVLVDYLESAEGQELLENCSDELIAETLQQNLSDIWEECPTYFSPGDWFEGCGGASFVLDEVPTMKSISEFVAYHVEEAHIYEHGCALESRDVNSYVVSVLEERLLELGVRGQSKVVYTATDGLSEVRQFSGRDDSYFGLFAICTPNDPPGSWGVFECQEDAEDALEDLISRAWEPLEFDYLLYDTVVEILAIQKLLENN